MHANDRAGLSDHRYEARDRASACASFEQFDEATRTLVVQAGEGEEPVRFPARREVCPTCEGKGSHVNPDVDSHGITAAEMFEDGDFAEDYFGGVFDVPCFECNGLRVVSVIDRELAEQQGLHAELAAYDQVADDRARDYAEHLAERRAGC